MSERLAVLWPPEPEYFLRGGAAINAPRPDITGMTHTGDAHGGQYYATDELVKELEGLGFPALDALGMYFHTTNGWALSGIARRGAIVSAEQLIKEGEIIHTGEYGEYIRLHEAQKQPSLNFPPRALNEVYGARSPNASYAFERGSFSVCFGIEGSAVRADGPGLPLLDHGDGIELGPQVSLDRVKSIIIPNEQVDGMREWADAHSPAARVLSTDACKVIVMGALQRIRPARGVLLARPEPRNLKTP